MPRFRYKAHTFPMTIKAYYEGYIIIWPALVAMDDSLFQICHS